MTQADISLPQRKPWSTSRQDRWWIQPLVVFLGLSAFIVYTTWAAFQGKHYFVAEGGAHYLSPFYSPLLYEGVNVEAWLGKASTHAAWIAPHPPTWWPSWLIFSPAFLILIGPAGMRFTCYYYRGAYYKAFWADPPSCAVGEPGFRGRKYRGEAKFPLILQNIHRFFFYPAAAFVCILLYDGIRAFFFDTPDGGVTFGVGLGSIILLMNAILLGGYTFGCHCARHIVGGHLDCISKSPIKRSCYPCVSALNRRHMQWAWVSLLWVALADVYVRLVSMNVINDVRFF